MDNSKLLLAYRGSTGLGFIHGPPLEGAFKGFSGDSSPMCRDMVFSDDGHFYGWCNGKSVKIISTTNFEVVCELPKAGTSNLKFSPKGTYVSTWEPYTVRENPQESCNLSIWRVKDACCMKSFIQKKQTNWHPEWSDDEHLCARNVSNEVHFYEAGNFDKIERKIHMQKVTAFSLAPGPKEYHVACYVPGVKGQPSFVRLFKHPNFDGASSVIAQKSFFKADRAEFYWNKLGKDLLVQSTVDVDKSGASYYGEQNLYYLNAKGETAKVMLGKDGPIYAVKWSPYSGEFCVVYGYMPAKATIYNLKCEPVFDFGTGPRNEVHFSDVGNRIILCGFGNLRGNIEVWDLKDKKQVSNFVSSDSTHLAWSPDGEYMLTATTFPRLRIGNGYRFWHYTGSLLLEKFLPVNDELYEMKWLPLPPDIVKSKTTNYTPVPGIESSRPQASKEAYRPPGARGQPSTFKLHDDDASSQTGKQPTQPLSKNQKKNLARKAKKEHEKMSADKSGFQSQNVQPSLSSTLQSGTAATGDPGKDKRIKALQKKLEQIEKLKQDQKSGKLLEKNQVDKIEKERELLEELQKLEL